MGFMLLPVAVMSFFIGLMAVESGREQDAITSKSQVISEQSGQSFIAYSGSVASYQQQNPSFTGVVPPASLNAQFQPTFLASAGNMITATPLGGRVITCYAALPTGAITSALAASGNDASIGVASGQKWTSAAQIQGLNYTPVALATSVPDGNIVSVVQIGN